MKKIKKIMKISIFIILIIGSIYMFFSTACYIYNKEVLTYDDDGTAITGINKDAKIIKISDYVGSKKIEKISLSSEKLEIIEVPNTIKSIGLRTPKLKKLYFNGTLEDWCSIDKGVITEKLYLKNKLNFYYELKDLNIPSSIKKIKDYSFANIGSIRKVTISNNIDSIGNYAFSNCKNLEKIVFKKNSLLEEIGYCAFEGCQSLKNITIPNNVSIIKQSAFYNCTSLKNVTIPRSVSIIEKSAFYNCTALENVYYNGPIENWCKIFFLDEFSTPMFYAKHFYMKDNENKYYKVEEIVIPNTVTRIGEYQFCGFDNLFSIAIPDSIIYIGDKAFYECYSLYSVDNNSSFNFVIGNILYGFISYYALKVNNRGVITYKDDAIIYDYIKTEDGFLFINHNYNYYLIKYMGDQKKPVIPFKINGNSYYYMGSDESLFNIELSDEFTYIPEKMFQNSRIKSIKIPNTVVNIYPNAFENCTTLEDVQFEENSQLKNIGNYAFSNCMSLTEIIIPESVESIEACTFSNCKSLTEIIIPKSVKSIEASAFSNCKSLTEIIIPESVKSIGEYAFENCTSLEKIIIPESLEYIANYVFYSCDKVVIYCEATSQPLKWESQWDVIERNIHIPNIQAPTIWGYSD